VTLQAVHGEFVAADAQTQPALCCPAQKRPTPRAARKQPPPTTRPACGSAVTKGGRQRAEAGSGGPLFPSTAALKKEQARTWSLSVAASTACSVAPSRRARATAEARARAASRKISAFAAACLWNSFSGCASPAQRPVHSRPCQSASAASQQASQQKRASQPPRHGTHWELAKPGSSGSSPSDESGCANPPEVCARTCVDRGPSGRRHCAHAGTLSRLPSVCDDAKGASENAQQPLATAGLSDSVKTPRRRSLTARISTCGVHAHAIAHAAQRGGAERRHGLGGERNSDPEKKPKATKPDTVRCNSVDFVLWSNTAQYS